MAKNLRAEGASKSLNKSIREIELFLAGAGLKPTNSDLRKELRKRIGLVAQKWFRAGFRRGCIECEKFYLARGKFPKKVRYDAKRDFFDGTKNAVTVTWKTKKS